MYRREQEPQKHAKTTSVDHGSDNSPELRSQDCGLKFRTWTYGAWLCNECIDVCILQSNTLVCLSTDMLQSETVRLMTSYSCVIVRECPIDACAGEDGKFEEVPRRFSVGPEAELHPCDST